MSAWKTNAEKPKNDSKIEIVYDATKPTEVCYFENGKIKYGFIKWKNVKLWRYNNE